MKSIYPSLSLCLKYFVACIFKHRLTLIALEHLHYCSWEQNRLLHAPRRLNYIYFKDDKYRLLINNRCLEADQHHVQS